MIKNSILLLLVLMGFHWVSGYSYSKPIDNVALYVECIPILNLFLLLIKFFKHQIVVESSITRPKQIDTPKKKPIIVPSTPIILQSPISPMKSHLMKRKEFSPIGSNITLRSSAKENWEQPITTPESFGTITLPNRFQNALKPTQSPQRNELIEDGLTFTNFEKTLVLFHADQHINFWSEQMRKVRLLCNTSGYPLKYWNV
jgi:hypothetical protein